MKKELIEEIAKEIVKFNNNIPHEDYWAHGEPHSYKPSITVEQIVKIINKHVKKD